MDITCGHPTTDAHAAFTCFAIESPLLHRLASQQIKLRPVYANNFYVFMFNPAIGSNKHNKELSLVTHFFEH